MILNRALATIVRADNTGVYPDIVLADLSTNQYFFEQNMRDAYYHVSVSAYFGSEDTINERQHLQWVEYSESRISISESGVGYYTIEAVKELQTPDGIFRYATLANEDFNNQSLIAQLERDAIRQQLNMFRSAQEYLRNTEGFLYSIRGYSSNTITSEMVRTESGLRYNNGDIPERAGQTVEYPWDDSNPFSYSNVGLDEQSLDAYFKSLPVFFISDGSPSPPAQSHFTGNYFFINEIMYESGIWNMHLAFTQDAVDAQNRIYSAARDAYIINFIIIAASFLLIIGMTVILMVGAGRRSQLVDGVKERAEGVHFSPVDKPYLDIGLFAVFCWTIFILYVSFYMATNVLHAGNTIAMNILFASMSLLLVPPALLWLLNLVKRIKAGRFWKHTLIYTIVYSFLFGSLRFLVRFVKSLWAGARLTLRVALISFAAFIVLLFIGFIGRGSLFILVAILIVTAAVTVLMLLYARRLRSLEQGAREASRGFYDAPIDAGGGELGSIAASINNISAGINKAVEERLKSERLKTELITNVSHDIRTPLTSIITYTDLLDREGLDCERAPEYLDVLKQKSQRLKTLTDELFEAAKAATGNIDVNLTDLNVTSLINQVLGELDSAVKSSGLDLRVNLPEKLYARADGRLMQRILENLLSNVFKYSMPGSRVYLDAFQTPDAQMRIDIKNISSQELNFDPSELTERFKRGDDSRADGGSGLGLSIVQSFVSAQNGKFEISIDGDLFKATVLLPVTMPPDIAIAASEPQSP